ncbi:intercellular adhesion molecule 2 isoform X2 [Nannospalax galili]|uniref:intercellular adhesion molecule 2 isoform X2 n=1 Tax=Nannospalax galili TaxID=1026970 RepID=UPI0004ED3203|nr:intercellular adhesion molecule 2 isoform X2 [Nannospalax galili]
MSYFGCWGLPMALLTLLCCPGSAEAFEVYIEFEKQVVEATESLKINCSTSCAEPELGDLETHLVKTMLDQHPKGRWKLFLVSNVSQDTVFLCHFTCAQKQQSRELRIRVYQPPTEVTLTLWPQRVLLGEAFTIECKTSAVKPLESLTLTLLHGKKILQIQTFEDSEPTLQEVTVTFNSTVSTKDSLNFSCQAELDLRPYGENITHCISKSQLLDVYGHGIQPHHMLEELLAGECLLHLVVA